MIIRIKYKSTQHGLISQIATKAQGLLMLSEATGMLGELERDVAQIHAGGIAVLVMELRDTASKALGSPPTHKRRRSDDSNG